MQDFQIGESRVRLYNADCFDVLPTLDPGCVDMVMCDPPYGITACKWDSAFDFDRMWDVLKRLCKERCAQVFTACQPFTSLLVCSNLRRFKVEWIWHKNQISNFGVVKYHPLRAHESVLVFSTGGGATNYYPIKEERLDRTGRGLAGPVRNIKWAGKSSENGGPPTPGEYRPASKPLRNPFSVQFIPCVPTTAKLGYDRHPTQKPVDLMSYFIRTYTQPGDTVLDFAMGSGTTGIAAVNTGRHFIGIELEQKYYDIAVNRIQKEGKPCDQT